MTDHARCRGCGIGLVDAIGQPAPPYYRSHYPHPYHPYTNHPAKSCYYGGFVCSESCDRKACLELEQSMPGHRGQTSLDSSFLRKLEIKWRS